MPGYPCCCGCPCTAAALLANPVPVGSPDTQHDLSGPDDLLAEYHSYSSDTWRFIAYAGLTYPKTSLGLYLKCEDDRWHAWGDYSVMQENEECYYIFDDAVCPSVDGDGHFTGTLILTHFTLSNLISDESCEPCVNVPSEYACPVCSGISPSYKNVAISGVTGACSTDVNRQFTADSSGNCEWLFYGVSYNSDIDVQLYISTNGRNVYYEIIVTNNITNAYRVFTKTIVGTTTVDCTHLDLSGMSLTSSDGAWDCDFTDVVFDDIDCTITTKPTSITLTFVAP